MSIDTIGAAIISISGAFFATASLWSLIGALLNLRSTRATPSAYTAHMITAAMIVVTGLVTHILGFFSEAFALLYAGGASMIVATLCVGTAPQPVRTWILVRGIVVAAGIIALSVGLLFQG
jgi:hypothetical protein